MKRADHLPGEWIELPDALLYWEPGFAARLGLDQAALCALLVAQVQWRQEYIRIYGREVAQPRLSAWYGDTGTAYSYSGIDLTPLPWLPELAALRGQLQTELSQPFNSVLINWYRDGGDSMGYHSDDEPELGPEPVIATVSLGATRRLLLRHRRRRDLGWSGDLEGGSLLVMAGGCQRCWRHAVPKTRRPAGGRLSLTYRRVYGAEL